VVNVLHGEQILTVLKEKGQSLYQVKDPGSYEIFGKEFDIPGREKVVTVNYDYISHYGYDLSKITVDNVDVDGNVIYVRLNKPALTSLEISNDHARTDGGLLISKKNPVDDIIRMDPTHDAYTNILYKNTITDLQESGKLQESQQVAMDRTEEAIYNLIKTAVTDEDIKVNVEFL